MDFALPPSFDGLPRHRVKAEAACRSALADPDVVTLRALELGLDWTLGPA